MRIFFLMLFITVLLGCAVQPNKYSIPKYNSKFNLNNYRDENGNMSLLDTNAVYYYKNTMHDTIADKDTLIHESRMFYRFFSNGTAYVSKPYSDEIQLKEYDVIENWEKKFDLTKGQKCYYTLQKDGVLKLEYYIDAYFGYMFYYAYVYEDKLIFFLTEERSSIFKTQTEIYKIAEKRKVPLTNFNVDW